MAQFKNDPFPGTDYTRYLEWPKVTTPNGETYYEVPGHPGYVYDPVASNATGRKTFRSNPKSQVEEYDAQKKAQKQAQFMQGPVGQILPVAAGTAGLIAANHFASPGATAMGLTSKGVLMSDGTIKGAEALATNAATPASAAAQGASGALSSVGSTAEPLMSIDPGIAANAATTESAAAAPSSFGLLSGNVAGTGLGVLPLAGIAAGTYLGGKSALNLLQGKSDNSLQGKLGRATLGIATGGISEIARPFLMKPSTRDIAKKHTSELLDQNPQDANWQGYVSGMREQYDSAPIDPSKPFAGKYGSWDEYKKNGLEAGDLTGVYGNLKTFGPAWSNLTQEQRQAITQANIDADNYDSKKGEVVIKDEKKAQDLFNSAIKGFQVGQASTASPVQIANTATLPNNVTPVTNIPTSPAQAAAIGSFKKIPIKVR